MHINERSLRSSRAICLYFVSKREEIDCSSFITPHFMCESGEIILVTDDHKCAEILSRVSYMSFNLRGKHSESGGSRGGGVGGWGMRLVSDMNFSYVMRIATVGPNFATEGPNFDTTIHDKIIQLSLPYNNCRLTIKKRA